MTEGDESDALLQKKDPEAKHNHGLPLKLALLGTLSRSATLLPSRPVSAIREPEPSL